MGKAVEETAQIDLKGDIIPNGDKWIYDWLEWDSVCPREISEAISRMQPEEELEVFINSGGGDVQAGQEIYSLLKSVNSVAKIQGFAASAAGVAAMGCRKVLISDVGTIMIHNVWCGGVSGDYHEMDKASGMLKALNESMANAYAAKSGRPVSEILEIMDRETWIPAEKAMEYGFADGLIPAEATKYTNSFCGLQLTEEIRQRVLKEKAERDEMENRKKELLKDLDLYGV